MKKDKRLIYRLILKGLTLLAVGVLLVVFFTSLFVPHPDEANERAKKLPQLALLTINLRQLKQGQFIKRRWHKREVVILYKDEPETSKNDRYFIYENYGDSGNCPLHYSSNQLKDICSGTLFDLSGKPLNKNKGFHLTIPPYSVIGEHIVIGKKGLTTLP